jgi:hypothetical protein
LPSAHEVPFGAVEWEQKPPLHESVVQGRPSLQFALVAQVPARAPISAGEYGRHETRRLSIVPFRVGSAANCESPSQLFTVAPS